jgi:hypothetical protein
MSKGTHWLATSKEISRNFAACHYLLRTGVFHQQSPKAFEVEGEFFHSAMTKSSAQEPDNLSAAVPAGGY